MAYVSMESLADALERGLSGKAYFGPGSSGAVPPPNVDLISPTPAPPPPPPQPVQWRPVTSVASAMDPRSLQAQNTYVAQQMEKGWTAEQMAAQPVYQNYAMQQMQAELARLRTQVATQPSVPDEYTKRLVEAQARAAAQAKAQAEAAERQRQEAAAKAKAEAEARAKAQAEAEARAAAMTQVESPYGQAYSPTYGGPPSYYQQPAQTYQQPAPIQQPTPVQPYQQPYQQTAPAQQVYQQPAPQPQAPAPAPQVAPPAAGTPAWVKPAAAVAVLFAA